MLWEFCRKWGNEAQAGSTRAQDQGAAVVHRLGRGFKAALVQAGKSVFDQATGRSVGFERCIGLAIADATINLAEADAGTLRAIDAMRDDEQHWSTWYPSNCSTATSVLG